MDLVSVLTDAFKALVTGIPVAGALYIAWKKHTIETAKAFATIVEQAVDRSKDIERLSTRLTEVERTTTAAIDKMDKVAERIDDVYRMLIAADKRA